MSLEDTIAEVRDLLDQRDEIDARLSELLGTGSKSPHVGDRKSGKPSRKMSVCSGCGKPGHKVTTCEKTKASDKRIRDTFGDSDDEEQKPMTQLTEADFDELKELQKNGELSSKVFAAEHDLPLSEVNRAISFRRYEDYFN